MDGGENAEFGVVTLARQRRISGGNRQKKSQPDKGWDFEYWWRRRESNPRPQALDFRIYMRSSLFDSRLTLPEEQGRRSASDSDS